MKKKFKIYLIVSVCLSLLCGIVATAFYIQYYFRFGYTTLEELLEHTNFNPWMWVVIPISFVVGFFSPLIAYILNKVESATIDKLP